jgi:hypothetical protein
MRSKAEAGTRIELKVKKRSSFLFRGTEGLAMLSIITMPWNKHFDSPGSRLYLYKSGKNKGVEKEWLFHPPCYPLPRDHRGGGCALQALSVRLASQSISLTNSFAYL